MDRRVAERWVRSVRYRYNVSPAATLEELKAILAQRGIAVAFCDRLKRPAYYWPEPTRMVLLRGCEDRFLLAWILAHELFHDLNDTERHAGAVYSYSSDRRQEEDTAADIFATLLCGGDPRGEKVEVRRSDPEPPTPEECFRAAMMPAVLDFGPEVWELGNRLLPHLRTAEEAREAADWVWAAYDGT